MPLFVLIYAYFIRFFYKLKIILGRLKHHLSLLIFILECQRNGYNFFQWGDEVPSSKNMTWVNDTEHVGIPGVTPIPAKGYSGENLLWDQMQIYTRFSRTGTMNEIVCSPELKGFTSGSEYCYDLLQIVYLTKTLKPRQCSHMEKDLPHIPCVHLDTYMYARPKYNLLKYD